MKIKIYNKWIDDPGGYKRPFKTIGQPKKLLDTQNYTGLQIIKRLAMRRARTVGKRANYLVVLKDKDYENSLIGSPEEIQKFVRDCLEDIGLMSRRQGGRR